MENKIEGIEEVSKTSKSGTQWNNSSEGLERAAPNKEHFEALLNAAQPNVPVIGKEPIDQIIQESSGIEKNPLFHTEGKISQQTGSATDQENKKHQGEIDEINETEGVNKKRPNAPTGLESEITNLDKQASHLSQLSPEQFKKQAQVVVVKIEKAKELLSQPDIKIKSSYASILKSHLHKVEEDLRAAYKVAKLDYPIHLAPPVQETNPLKKFLGFLTNGQAQLNNLTQDVSAINHSASPMNYGQMLALQMRVNSIQQQIELFTSLLTKALESVKAVMNVQI